MVFQAGGLMMQMPIGTEWIVIIVVIVVVFFGVKKIPELARSLGKASGEFQKAKLEGGREIQRLKGQGGLERSKLEDIAYTLGIDSADKNDVELRTEIDAKLNRNKV